MSTSADIAKAAQQPTGKVGTEDQLLPPFAQEVSPGIPDSKLVDPTAQHHAEREHDPNYIPGAPDVPPPQPTIGDAVAAGIEALPTGTAGGSKVGDLQGKKAGGAPKIDPALGRPGDK